MAWWSAYFLINHNIEPERFYRKPKALKLFYIAAASMARAGLADLKNKDIIHVKR